MAASLVKSVMLKIVADDGDSEAKLDNITRKAEELARQHPDLKVKVDSAAASAKLAVLRKELKDTGNAAAGDDTSLRSRLLSLGGAASSITGLGDAFAIASPEASMFQKVMAGAGLATGLLEPVMAGAVVAVGGLSSGLVAAGAGLGVFGLVAKSAFAQVTAADTAGKKLAGGMGDLQRSLAGATGEWNKFVSANASGVAKVMSQGIGLLPKLLSAVQPLLAPTEKALSGLVSQLGRGLDSSGFKSFMDVLAKNTGPAITKLGDAIGHIVTGIGGILKAFMPASQSIMSGLDRMTEKFARWGTTLGSHSGFRSLMEMFEQETPKAMGILRNLGTVIVNIGKAMAGLSTFSNGKMLLQVLGPLSGILASLSKNTDLVRIALYGLAAKDLGGKLKSTFDGISGGLSAVKKGASNFQDLKSGFSNASAAASEATGKWGTFGGKVSVLGGSFKALGAKMGILKGATAAETVEQEGLDVAMDASPIGAIIVVVGLLAVAFAILILKCKPFREFWTGLWKDAKKIVREGIDWIKSHWKLLPAILLGPIGIAVTLVLLHFRQMKDGAERVVHDVISFFAGLPHRIVSALGDLGHLLLQGGINLVMGLVHGIESVAMAPVHAISSIVSDVRSFLPFSPAKKGPLSGSGSPLIAGAKIGQMLAAGITSSTSGVAASAHRMAGAAVITASGGAAGSGSLASALGGMSLQVKPGGGNQLEQLLVLVLRQFVRVNFGGDVQKAFGH